MILKFVHDFIPKSKNCIILIYLYHFLCFDITSIISKNYLACTSLTTLSDQPLNQPASKDAIYLTLPETVQVQYKSQQAIWFLD